MELSTYLYKDLVDTLNSWPSYEELSIERKYLYGLMVDEIQQRDCLYSMLPKNHQSTMIKMCSDRII